MKQSLKVLALSAAVLLGATAAKAAANGNDAAALGAAAQTIGAAVATQVQQSKDAQAQTAADAEKAPAAQAKETPARVAGAGKGLRTEEFPIDPKIAKLSSYVLKESLEPADGVHAEDHSWRRNDWGICRAWLTCNSGRQISCWAQGWNCDAWSNFGDHANVVCEAWGGGSAPSKSWDSCP
ncbi:MAG: hypothetical protein ACHQ49_18535 [Elusimicrobiota bacterium]